jgi:paraquat-inducible protein B
MSPTMVRSHGDELLTGDVIAHLDQQLLAARRLLGLVLEQGAAIRRRDVQEVVRIAGIIQVELQRRKLLEEQRMRLLERAGARLSVAPTAVTLSLLQQLMHGNAAAAAGERSAELRGLLAETQREHHTNRALMNQELAFLDHLLRLTGQATGVYDSAGDRTDTTTASNPGRMRVLDLEA